MTNSNIFQENQIFKINFKHNFLLKQILKRAKLLYISCLFIGKMPWKPINIYHIVSYKEITYKKTILIQNLIKIFTKTLKIAHFFKNFSQGIACPLTCVQQISLFLYEKNHQIRAIRALFTQNAFKIYTKTH